MRRQLVKIITLSFVLFWIVSSIIWLQNHNQSSKRQADDFAIGFHELVIKKFNFFEKVFEFPNTIFSNNFKSSLPHLSEMIHLGDKPVNQWTDEELKHLAKQFNLSEIHLMDQSARVLASSQSEAINTIFTHPIAKQSRILNNLLGEDKVIIHTPTLDFQSGVLHLSALYGPRLQPDVLISVSIDIRQFESEGSSSGLIDHMFYQFFADIQKDKFDVAEFDLMFVKNNEHFSLIGSDPRLQNINPENFPENIQLSLDQRVVSGLSVIPISTSELDYGDFIIIQSKHNLELGDQGFLKNWLTASSLLLALLLITLFGVSTNFVRAIKENSLRIHQGLDRIEKGDYKSEITIAGVGDEAGIAKHINEVIKTLSENESLHQSSKHDMEKLINDRTYALRQEIEERANIESQIQEMSLTDHLTKSGNRRYFDQSLAAQFALFNRKKVPFSMNLIDIDHFKQTNDLHGHPAGDAILIQLTSLISALIREYDYFCRIGGEEFAIILPETDLEGAKRFAQRVLEEVRKSTFIIDGGTLNTTVSIGVAEISPRDENEYALLKRADHALYKAKRAGRNRLELQ